jgi:hypothetical protein
VSMSGVDASVQRRFGRRGAANFVAHDAVALSRRSVARRRAAACSRGCIGV